MAVSQIIIEDTTDSSKYSVQLSGGKLSLVKLSQDDDTPVTSGAIIQDDITGIDYVFRLAGGKLTLTSVDGDGSDVIEVQLSSSWPAVHALSDGDPVDAETLNKPLQELTERTGYLYDKLRAFDRENPMALLVILNAKLASTDTPGVGDIVYFDADTGSYAKAVASVSLFDQFSASNSAYAVGMVIARGGTTGKIALAGLVDMSSKSFDISGMLEDGEAFRDGMYYLSSTEPGKITAYPSGPKVFIGSFVGRSKNGVVFADKALLSIEHKDMAESHVHRAYLIGGLPAGGQYVEGEIPDGKHVFVGFAPDVYVNPERDAEAFPDTDIFPRLVFSGEWLNTDDCKYEFVLGGPIAEDDETRAEQLAFGNNPGVFLHWYNKTEGTSGSIQVEGFKVRYPVEHGMFVELRKPENSDDESLVYRVADDSDEKRTWSTGMVFPDIAKGWRDLSDEELSRFSGPESTKPKFVYNIGFDRAMQTYYPPVPAGAASLVMNGVELSSKSLGGKYVFSIESDSIYWYDDTWGHAPWPVNYTSRYTDTEAWEEHRLVLHFTKATSSSTGPVTSIRARKGSGLHIYSCGSDSESDVGDLEIDFDPIGDVVEDELEGYKVVKSGSGGKLKTGPVVERIVAGTGIKLTRWGSQPKGQGTVIISTIEGGVQGDFEEVALQNAKQDMVGMFPYVRLLGWNDGTDVQNIPSAFVLKFHVPYSTANALYRVNLYANVFGTQSYTDSSIRYAGVLMDYNVLPDLNPVDADGTGTYEAANVQDDLIKPDTARIVEIPIVSAITDDTTTYRAFDPVLIHTEDGTDNIPCRLYDAIGSQLPDFNECSKYLSKHEDVSISSFGIRPGYTVAVRISRSGIASGASPYTAPIGFINMRWSLDMVV